MFDGVEIGGIGGEIEERVSGLLDGILAVLPFVESRIVHHHDAVWWEFWEQIFHHPNMKDIGVDVGFEQANGRQEFADQSADGIGAASGLPVVRAVTALSFEAVAMGARHIMGKAALVDIDDGARLGFIGRNFLAEDVPCAFVRPWMTQHFFYMLFPSA